MQLLKFLFLNSPSDSMKVLILAEKQETAKPFISAMKARGIKANYLQLIKISLVSKHKNTIIKAIDENIPKYDAVFLQARPNLAPFLEPLIEALKDKGVYCNALPGAYYLAVNEPYRFVNLSANGVKTPKVLVSGSSKNIERVSKKIAYPLIAKSYLGKDVQQSTIVEKDSELNNFVKSIKTKIDGFMLREYINDCVVSLVVIDDKVYGINRKSGGKCVELEKGKSYSPTDEEKRIAISATKASKLDIAKVDMVKGRVINVETIIPIKTFNKICSVKIEDNIASYYKDKINEIGPKRSAKDDFIDFANSVQKTVFGRFLK
jgi:glutathione synthase/RimK-type ligase-like ATP-grasp enzyme